MELRLLRYFSVLAEELHFSRAAARLAISQPPLSVAIRQLEDSVGAKLFERSSRDVRLTAAGAALQRSARRLLAQADEAAAEARQVAEGTAGRLRVGFVGAMLYGRLPQALQACQQQLPRVRCTLSEQNSADQLQALSHGQLDLGFVHTRHLPAELASRLIQSEPFVCCLPERHRLTGQRQLALPALADEAFIMFARSVSPDYHERVLAICADAGFRPEIRHEVRHWLAAVSLVSQGLGVALVPAAMQGSRLGGAIYRPLSDGVAREARSEVRAVWPREPDNPLVKAFLQAFD